MPTEHECVTFCLQSTVIVVTFEGSGRKKVSSGRLIRAVLYYLLAGRSAKVVVDSQHRNLVVRRSEKRKNILLLTRFSFY